MNRKYKARIIYSINLNFKKFFVVFFLLLFITLTIVTYTIVEKELTPAITTLALSEINTLCTKLINDAVIEIAVKDADYSALCTISKNEKGEILSVSSNPRELNNIKTKITSMLIDTVNQWTTHEVYIPIGQLTNTSFLLGKGFKIPIDLLITGSPKIDFDNRFETAGINQTKHKISIITYVEFDIVLPYETVRTSMETETLLYETVIVGNIPEVYVAR